MLARNKGKLVQHGNISKHFTWSNGTGKRVKRRDGAIPA